MERKKRKRQSKQQLTYLSGYRILWCLVMFDLPTDTRKQRKAATDFREFLLNEGFERSQFSVYARFVHGKAGFDTKVRRIRANMPDVGDVQILQFTDKQYEKMIHFSNHGRVISKKNPGQLALF